MTVKRPARQLKRRPPASGPPEVLLSRTNSPPAAGGPATRGKSVLGRFLLDVLAYFEVRSVSPEEMDLVRPSHDNGWLRPEIEAKLARLHPACPDHLELARLVRTSLEVLEAVDAGRFDPGPAWPHVERRLLRALAYFVREGDAIPDHLPHGFDDDRREFAELAEQAGVVFSAFEARRKRALRRRLAIE